MSTQTMAVPGFPIPIQVQTNKIKIISICPFACQYELRGRPWGEKPGMTQYFLPPAEHGKHEEIEVEDIWEWSMNWEAQPPTLQPMPKSAGHVACVLVDTWTSNMFGSNKGGRLGIAVRDEARPLEEQLAELAGLQTLLANTLVDEAQAYFNNKEYKAISDLHRSMARWLGVDVEWLADLRKQKPVMKPCPACGEEIAAPALRCRHCNVNLPEWYLAYGLDPSQDPVVQAAIGRFKAASEEKAVADQSPESADSVQRTLPKSLEEKQAELRAKLGK